MTRGQPPPLRNGAEIVLFNTPWVSPSHAPLGLGIVTAQLRSAGFDVDVHHANVAFYRLLHEGFGPDVARRVYASGQVGEVAAGLLYRQLRNPFDPEVEDLATLLHDHRIDEATFWSVVRALKHFTARSLADLDLSSVGAVGFSLCIRQTMSSLYWAQQIKRLAPHVHIVFGGSTCEDPMGLSLMTSHDMIDVIARGEADTSIVPLFEHLLDRSDRPVDSIPNIAFRRDGCVVATEREQITMDAAVAPDHTDFMTEYRLLEAHTGEPANLYIEASRGCWWGEKRQCSFCGIHTTAIEFRSKDAGRVLAEASDLLARHQVFRFVLADTILSKQHVETLLPQLEALRAEHDFEYLLDVKSPLGREEVELLAATGCKALQVGIEALNDRLLRQVMKGNTALQQIQAIRRCTEAGIHPFYAILTHIIGETAADYDETLANMAHLRHLAPPSGVFPIEINRYAPYHDRWHELGFDRPEPAPFYRFMFGDDGTDLDEFAYHFVGVHPSTVGADLEAARERVIRFVEDDWKPSNHHVHLSYRIGRGFVQVTDGDRRLGPLVRHRLSGVMGELFLACDEIVTRRDLDQRLGQSIDEQTLTETLDEWCERGWMLRSTRGDVYLTLAVCEHPGRSRGSSTDHAARADRPTRLRQIPVTAA